MADKKISQLTGATTPLAGTEVLPIVQGGSTVKVSVDNLTTGKTVSVGSLSSAGAISGTTGAFSGAVTVTNATVDLTNAYYVRGKLVAGTNVAMIGRNASDQVAIDPDGYGTVIGFSGARLQVASGNATLQNGNFVVGTAAKGIDFSANTHAAGMTSELLNWYEEGTWTPTDVSGASLTFTSATGRYTRVGNVVFLFGFVQYPVTASGSNASIGGLPFTVNSNSSALQGAVTYSQVATVRSIGVNPSTTNTTVYTFAGTAVTNATLSGTVLYFNSTYFV